MRYLVPILALVGAITVGMWGYNRFIAGDSGNGG